MTAPNEPQAPLPGKLATLHSSLRPGEIQYLTATFAEPSVIPADRLVVISAFRYALGRTNYIVEHIANWVIFHHHKLSKHDRALIAREIDEAIRLRQIGMDCDAEQWGRVRDAMAVDRALGQEQEDGS